MSITLEFTLEGKPSHIGGTKVMLPEIEESMAVAREKEDTDNDCNSNKSG